MEDVYNKTFLDLAKIFAMFSEDISKLDVEGTENKRIQKKASQKALEASQELTKLVAHRRAARYFKDVVIYCSSYNEEVEFDVNRDDANKYKRYRYFVPSGSGETDVIVSYNLVKDGEITDLVFINQKTGDAYHSFEKLKEEERRVKL
jgi:hypothetical protein